jgi:hypothetical protein
MFKSEFGENLFYLFSMLVEKGDKVGGYPLLADASDSLQIIEEEFSNLSADQAVIINEAIFGDSNFLTICGKAGVGKTYIVKLLRLIFETTLNANLIVCASTGIASQNCDGAGTLHSVFSIGKGNKLPWAMQEDIEGTKQSFSRKSAYKVASQIWGRSLLANLDLKLPSVIIVDEISMVSSELLNVIYQIALYRHGGELSISQAANNIKFIGVGDTMQLLPIPPTSKKSREKVSYPWRPARFDLGDQQLTLNSLMYNDACFEGYKAKSLALLTNHRQYDQKAFTEALNYIRLGGSINEGPALTLKKRIVRNLEKIPQGLDVIHAYFSNAECSEKNKEVVQSLDPKKRKTFYAKIESYRTSNQIISGDVIREDEVQLSNRRYPQKVIVVEDKDGKEHNVPKDWLPTWAMPVQELGIGLPFMVRQNMPTRDLFNGTVGIIEDFGKGEIVLSLEDGRVETLSYEACVGVGVDQKGKERGVYKSLPGHICSAMTVSKSQGLTINKPYVLHLNSKYIRMIPPHWIYVGLSRVTRPDLLYIVGSPSSINASIKVDESALNFTRKAELNMQDECEGQILDETVTPEQVKNCIPILDKVELGDDPNKLYCYFRLYVEPDSSTTILATHNKSNDFTHYYDLEEEIDFGYNGNWKLHPYAKEAINRYLYSETQDSILSSPYEQLENRNKKVA